MLYILLGEDDFSLRQSLEEIKGSIGDQTILAANTTVFEGQQLTPDHLRNACETVPFLAEKRLVIVNGLLGRFEPKSKPSPKKKATPSTNQQSDYKSFVACITEIPGSAILVLVDSKIGSNNPLLKALSPKAKVQTFPLLKGDKLKQWIQKRVAAGGGSISSQAVDALAGLVGGDLWLMANEVDKLILFASGRRIEEEDVKRLVSYAQEASVFTMVDAVLDFKAGLAGQSLQQLLQGGAAPPYLLVMLARQVRMIVRAKELKRQGKPEAEIQNKLGLREFALHKTLEQAGKYSWERLKDVYNKILETDLAIKTGKYGDELALNILVAELCQRR